jgi:hypothetical protein
MKVLYSILFCILFSSCATLMNTESMDIYVDSEADPVKFKLSTDSTTWHQTPVLLSVDRSKKDIEVTVLQDSTESQFILKHGITPAFLIGNIFTPSIFFGYIVDLTNNKRFNYPSHVTLRKNEKPKLGLIPTSKLRKNGKGDLLAQFSFDSGNQSKAFNYSGQENLSTVIGVSFGMGYYPWKKYGITLNGGAVYKPGVFFDRLFGGPVINSSTGWISLQLDTDLSFVHFDLGVQYNNSLMEKKVRYENSSGIKYWVTTHKENHHNFGLACSAYIKLFENFRFGIDYLPSLLVLDNGQLNAHYSNLILVKIGFIKSIHSAKKHQQKNT